MSEGVILLRLHVNMQTKDFQTVALLLNTIPTSSDEMTVKITQKTISVQ